MKKLAYAMGVWIAAVILGDTATGGDPLVEADMGAGRGQGIIKQEIADSAESFRFEDYQNFASGQAETFIEEARAASAAALQNLYKVFPVGSPVERLVDLLKALMKIAETTVAGGQARQIGFFASMRTCGHRIQRGSLY